MAFRMSGTARAICFVWRIFRLCAEVLGVKPISSITCSTNALVLELIPSELLIALETVAIPTPARFATSSMVTLFLLAKLIVPSFSESFP
ncbi:hypothetical protein D3C71_1873030 [compost metagenome]